MQAHMSLAAHLRNRASKGVFWFHPANGEYRGLATGAKLNQMGVKAGTPRPREGSALATRTLEVWPGACLRLVGVHGVRWMQ